MNKNITAIDLFCGCGGVTEGLKRQGFKVVAAVDYDPVACRTYRANHREVKLIEKDIRAVDPPMLLNDLLNGRFLDLLVVCAPCQPFSNQNRKKGNDDRVELVLETIRFAAVLQPKIIMFENVPGLTSPRFSAILKELKRGLNEEGYMAGAPITVDVADYCVPQRRLRCIMFAARNHPPPEFPKPVTPPGRRITVRDVIDNLRRLQSAQADPEDKLHFARDHRSIALKRMSYIPKNGGGRFSLPDYLVLDCHKEHKGYPDVYGRMSWNDVAPTLTTGCTDITRGRFIHPEDDRAITLREASRLQSFPDSYHFEGSAKDIAIQIGNAVPVKFIEVIGPTLLKSIASLNRKVLG